MVMKFYATVTPNAQRAILPLFFADVDAEKEVELVAVNLMGLQQRSPKYKAMHPFGVVPYLEDGDVGVFESRAIAKYIVDKYELTFLVGKTAKERAAINQWLESESHNIHPTVGPVMRELFMARMFKRDPDAKLIAAKVADLRKVLDVYEAQLSKHKYLAGDTYTLADAFHTPSLEKVRTVETFAGVLDERPHVKAWVADITSNPAFVKTLKLDWDNATPF